MSKPYNERTYEVERRAIIEAMQRQEHALNTQDAELYERATQQLCHARRDMAVAIQRNSLPGGPR